MKNKKITHAKVHFVLAVEASFAYVDIHTISHIVSGKIETVKYFIKFALFVSYDTNANKPNIVLMAHHCPPNHPKAPSIPSHICTLVMSVEYPNASEYEIWGTKDAQVSIIFCTIRARVCVSVRCY
jgi:hypothetical protein